MVCKVSNYILRSSSSILFENLGPNHRTRLNSSLFRNLRSVSVCWARGVGSLLEAAELSAFAHTFLSYYLLLGVLLFFLIIWFITSVMAMLSLLLFGHCSKQNFAQTSRKILIIAELYYIAE